jgi:hypothetical protein
MKKIISFLLSFLFLASTVLADTTRNEASDDGNIYRDGSSYSVDDYSGSGPTYPPYYPYYIRAWFSDESPTKERRAYKRFIMDLGSYTITSATLYWYLVEADPDGGCTTSCKLEQINDYGTLNATSAEFTGTVKHDYGNVMTYNQAAGWDSVDVTAEMEASKADPYVAFRWRVASQPASGDINYNIAAYEATDFKSYLVITTSTGWSHKRDGVANASIAKIDGVAKSSIAKVDGK